MSHIPKLDLSKYDLLAAKDMLFYYVCEKARSWGYNPNVECALLSPKQSKNLGLDPVWRVMWESGSHDWGVYLSLGGVTFVKYDGDWNINEPEIVLGQPKDWYLEPYYGFDVGFITDTLYADFECDRSNEIITITNFVSEQLINARDFPSSQNS